MHNGQRGGRRRQPQAVPISNTSGRFRALTLLCGWLALGMLVALGAWFATMGTLTFEGPIGLAAAAPVADPEVAPPATAELQPTVEPTTAPPVAPPPPPRPFLAAGLPPPVAAPAARTSLTGPPPSPSPLPEPLATAGCFIGTSFARLAEALGEERIGRCLESEQADLATGDARQRTAGGLLVRIKAQGVAAFTDGTSTWYECTSGIERRATNAAFPC